jgi:phage virion morphogenesis protein
MRLNVKFDTKKVQKAIKQTKKQLKNNKSVLRKIGEKEIADTKRRIRTGKTSPDGNRWAPWSYATLEARRREGTASRGLLYRTGELYRSFKMKITNTALSIHSLKRYASYLQFGTPDMPARKFLGWSRRGKQQVVKIFKHNIMRGWK